MAELRKLLPPIASGFLFGMGLTVSGMTDPQRVRGFLDLFGDWDPTLAFVMGGAVLVMAVAWRVQARMTKPVFGEKFALPDQTDLDPRLIAGGALFGIGGMIVALPVAAFVVVLLEDVWGLNLRGDPGQAETLVSDSHPPEPAAEPPAEPS